MPFYLPKISLHTIVRYITINQNSKGNIMKIMSSTELRTKSNEAYNEVMKNGAVSIKHRDRPPMILISVDELNKRLNKAKSEEK